MDDPLDAIRWRDEILQIMYWFRGEGLGESVTALDLVTFLGADADAIGRHLDRLSAEGCVERSGGMPARYRLTDWGIQEGGRRFADEFAGLTGQAHGECNNPDCACQSQGPDACEARTAHTHR